MSTERKKIYNTSQSDISKTFHINGVYPADTRDELLNNSDVQKKMYSSISKNKCTTIVGKVNGVHTEIRIDTGAELSVINQKLYK